MKILFIYPNATHQEAISTGLAYISGWLKKKKRNYDIKIFDFTWGARKQECYDFIKEFEPDVIGITCVTFDFYFCKDLIKGIKKVSNALIVLGGVHPTIAPEQSIKYADIICIGEGERSFEELIEKLENNEDYTKINNLWVKKNNIIHKNQVGNLIENLDLLFCDRDLYDIDKYVKARNYTMDIYVGRGCPYDCTYCINYYHRNLYQGKGKFLRLSSPENTINEIKNLVQRFHLKKIICPDDTLTYSKKWLFKFCDLYKKEIRLPFVCNARVENIDDEVCKALKQANCDALHIGVESGNEKLRKTVLNRHMSNKQIIKVFQLCKKYGIKTLSFNMVGIPYETKEDILKTIQLNRIIEPTELQVTIYHPFPGTYLYDHVCKKGWIIKKKIDDLQYASIMDYPQINAKTIKKMHDRFAFDVFVKIDLFKAIRMLFQGKFYNKYVDYRPKIPLTLRKIIQKIANAV
ncbi:MAG: B12-binding domain-containing radical SAM protein [Promethearchaeota archaeon]